jgi:hypothetical protein
MSPSKSRFIKHHFKANHRKGKVWTDLVGVTPYTMLVCGVSWRQYGIHSPAETSPVVSGLKCSEMRVTRKPGIVSWANTAVLSPTIPAPITAT